MMSLIHAGAGSDARASYRSLEKLPDFGGWWYLRLAPDENPARYYAGAAFRPEVAAKLASLGPDPRSGDGSTLKALQCRPPKFIGLSGGFVEDIEFLFTPGRVTLLNESGLVRRIFTDDTRPDEAEQTNAGLSTGHWEGRTLVVETHALNPSAPIGPNWPGVPTIGRNARVSERMSLKDADTLEIVMRLDAPEALTEPFTTTFVYERDHGHRFHEQSDCVDEDRAIDPASGSQRFDLSPPTDLPPPPSDDAPFSEATWDAIRRGVYLQ
jgi:hypothetical protein